MCPGRLFDRNMLGLIRPDQLCAGNMLDTIVEYLISRASLTGSNDSSLICREPRRRASSSDSPLGRNPRGRTSR
nr:hypothetical protein CFP56_34450 [Quercus suber]